MGNTVGHGETSTTQDDHVSVQHAAPLSPDDGNTKQTGVSHVGCRCGALRVVCTLNVKAMREEHHASSSMGYCPFRDLHTVHTSVAAKCPSRWRRRSDTCCLTRTQRHPTGTKSGPATMVTDDKARHIIGRIRQQTPNLFSSGGCVERGDPLGMIDAGHVVWRCRTRNLPRDGRRNVRGLGVPPTYIKEYIAA